MCHRHLNVEFNRHTNLVVGANGSGKSAILTALIIGLGSKANATNRSTSIKRMHPLLLILIYLKCALYIFYYVNNIFFRQNS